jgi:hypothetical protein
VPVISVSTPCAPSPCTWRTGATCWRTSARCCRGPTRRWPTLPALPGPLRRGQRRLDARELHGQATLRGRPDPAWPAEMVRRVAASWSSTWPSWAATAACSAPAGGAERRGGRGGALAVRDHLRPVPGGRWPTCWPS